jgi:hypothetical protein
MFKLWKVKKKRERGEERLPYDHNHFDKVLNNIVERYLRSLAVNGHVNQEIFHQILIDL